MTLATFAVFVGLAGVLVVLQPGEVEFSLGHLAALSAALTGSLTSVIVRKIGAEERSAVLMLYPMVATFLLTGALALAACSGNGDEAPPARPAMVVQARAGRLNIKTNRSNNASRGNKYMVFIILFLIFG